MKKKAFTAVEALAVVVIIGSIITAGNAVIDHMQDEIDDLKQEKEIYQMKLEEYVNERD